MTLGPILLIVLVLILVGVIPGLAPQPRMGLRSQRRPWAGVGNRARSAAARQVIGRSKLVD
jgi:hypothetical protein